MIKGNMILITIGGIEKPSFYLKEDTLSFIDPSLPIKVKNDAWRKENKRGGMSQAKRRKLNRRK